MAIPQPWKKRLPGPPTTPFLTCLILYGAIGACAAPDEDAFREGGAIYDPDIGTLSDEMVQRVGQFFAEVLNSDSVRQEVYRALKNDSDHRLRFRDHVQYLARSHNFVQLALGDSSSVALEYMDGYELWIPSAEHRTNWSGGPDAIVVASTQSDLGVSDGSSEVTGFWIGGEPVRIPLFDDVDHPVLVVVPAPSQGITTPQEERQRIRPDWDADSGSKQLEYSFKQCLKPDDDLDLDGLADRCEFDVAKEFRPELRFHPDEKARSRETYWAARRGAGESFEVFYALAYHRDSGYRFGIGKHDGDGEFIIVRVHNTRDEQWKAESVTISAHWNHWWPWADQTKTVRTFQRNNDGHPVIWVAKGKHANYESRSACNDGAWKADDCGKSNRNRDRELVTVERSTNLGGSGAPLVNCAWSRSDEQGMECFWSPRRFYGWQKDRELVETGKSYLNSLVYFGFCPFKVPKIGGFASELEGVKELRAVCTGPAVSWPLN